ncbi:GrpB family protein [Veronia pacifica]|uniref:GrpB family protein n=1 Tax=Veronia pacifica TaxID=1080227 RepID=UPI0009F41E1B
MTGIAEECIQHIGSTAIQGITAKPIIDIAIGIDSLNDINDKLTSQLKTLGFIPMPRQMMEGRFILAKYTDDTCQVKTHYIHFVELEGSAWSDLLFFRDHLNQNQQARAEYAAIKQHAAEKYNHIEQYTDAKESFVKKIFSQR